MRPADGHRERLAEIPVAREKTFGPVVAILSFADEAPAVALANDSTYGPAAAIFTHDIDVAHRLAREVRAGTVTVNCYGEGDITAPSGGYMQSGFEGPLQKARNAQPVLRAERHLVCAERAVHVILHERGLAA